MMRLSLCVLLTVADLVRSKPTTCKGVKPLKIDLSAKVPHMLDLIRLTELPPKDLEAARESDNMTESFGIGLSTISNWRDEWINDFDWDTEQVKLNKLNHYETTIEGLKIHFVHHKSSQPDAIPLIALHGWPGSFMEMKPLIPRLTKSPEGQNEPTFDLVIPSLIGYGLSSPAPDGWNITDSARVFNTLMTKVLGYDKYAVHGTDWGAVVAYQMYTNFNESNRAAHFTIIPFTPQSEAQLAEKNINLTEGETFQLQRSNDWVNGGSAYFNLQQTKPNTIGLALHDNPVGQLAWIGEKFISWSDPRPGIGSSLLTSTEILRHVTWYYLTETFISSAYMYAQNPNGWIGEYSMAKTDAPMLFSSFKWNIAFWPRELIATVGNLVYYKFHEFGGHFQSLEDPDAVAEDIRQIAKYW